MLFLHTFFRTESITGRSSLGSVVMAMYCCLDELDLISAGDVGIGLWPNLFRCFGKSSTLHVGTCKHQNRSVHTVHSAKRRCFFLSV